jgi:hypothetical protein
MIRRIQQIPGTASVIRHAVPLHVVPLRMDARSGPG